MSTFIGTHWAVMICFDDLTEYHIFPSKDAAYNFWEALLFDPTPHQPTPISTTVGQWHHQSLSDDETTIYLHLEPTPCAP